MIDTLKGADCLNKHYDMHDVGNCMNMFDQMDQTLFSSSMFSWQADFQSKTVTVVCLCSGKNYCWTFYDILKSMHDYDAEKLNSLLFAERYENRQSLDIEFRANMNGAFHNFRVKGTLHKITDDQIYASGFGYDINNTMEHVQRLKYLEEHDSLTGLKNSQKLDEFFKTIEDGSIMPQALVVANIDGLREINDSLGYYAGNTLIKNVANVLKDCFDDAQIIARIAGGEYCAVFFGKNSVEIEMKIKEANMILHRMYLNLIKTEVSFGYVVSDVPLEFCSRYRQVMQSMERAKSIKKLLEKGHMIEQIHQIVSTKAGWGKREVRLQSLCAKIAAELDCGEDCIREAKALARIADVGLIGLCDRLIMNRIRLGGKDIIDYLDHIEYGRKMIAGLEDTAELETEYTQIYQRYDEWGEALALSSRIVAVAIQYDDITYGSENVQFDTIESRLRSKSGLIYCPKVIDAIISIMSRHLA